MSADGLFSVANTAALCGWLLLIFAPRRRWAQAVVSTLPLLLAGLYVFLLFAHWGEAKGSFSTLDDVASLFSNRWVLLAGWVHYLAFDLFIGAWQVRDAAERGINHLLVVPCLLLTFLFGPAGLLLYASVRRIAVPRKPTALPPLPPHPVSAAR